MNKESHPVLEAKGLAKGFAYEGGSVDVLSGVDLRLTSGHSVSVRGESGCGKTTLLNLLARLETADAGSLSWDGSELDPKAPPSSREATLRACFLGVVYQAYYLMPELNALENVLIAGRIAGRLNTPTEDRARHLLDRVGVGGRERQMTSKMSGGERQRIAIARALLNQPKLILADEPTGNLDERTADEVIELLLEACREEGASLLLVTHNFAYAKATDEALVMSDGHLRTT